MSAEAALAVRTWPVGRFRCTLSIPKTHPGAMAMAAVEWSPTMPRRPLTATEIREYREGRDRALAELSAELGINAAVVEL